MKTIYFVRHGESEGNVDNSVQSLEAQLTEEGRRQAQLIAKRCKEMEFETLIASDMRRAQQTAQAIAEVTGHEITSTPQFREVHRPNALQGMSRFGDQYQRFITEFHANMSDPEWRYEDAETYPELIQRARDALAHLEELSHDRILVVTHGLFLKTMISLILTRNELTPQVWKQMSQTLHVTNTGITVCKHKDGVWNLMTWNDRAHFAE